MNWSTQPVFERIDDSVGRRFIQSNLMKKKRTPDLSRHLWAADHCLMKGKSVMDHYYRSTATAIRRSRSTSSATLWERMEVCRPQVVPCCRLNPVCRCQHLGSSQRHHICDEERPWMCVSVCKRERERWVDERVGLLCVQRCRWDLIKNGELEK